MWSTLVGLIERWWREKPRLDVVRATVRLRDAMIKCQDAYSEHRARAREITVPSGSSPYDEWKSSLDDLSDAVLELDRVITIFGPDSRRAIRGYLELDVIELQRAHAVNAGASASGEDEFFDLDDFDHPKLAETFDEALEQLDHFIRSNFKPEDVWGVTKSSLR